MSVATSRSEEETDSTSEPDNCPTRSTNDDSVADALPSARLAAAQRRSTTENSPDDDLGCMAQTDIGDHLTRPRHPTRRTRILACVRACPPGGVGHAWLGDEEPTRESVQADALGRRLSPSRHELRERASPIILPPVHTFPLRWPEFLNVVQTQKRTFFL